MQSPAEETVVTSITNPSKKPTQKMGKLRDFLHDKGFLFEFGSFGTKTKNGKGVGIKPELNGVSLYLESYKTPAQLIAQLKQNGITDSITADIKGIKKNAYFHPGNGPNIIYFNGTFPDIPREQGGGSVSQQTLTLQGGGTRASQVQQHAAQQGGGASSPEQQDDVVQSHTVLTIQSVPQRRKIDSDMEKLKQYLDEKNFHFNYGIFKTESLSGWKRKVNPFTDPVSLYLEGGYKTKSKLIQDLKSKNIPNNVCQHIKVMRKKDNPATKLYFFSSIPTVPESSLDTTLSSLLQGGGASSSQTKQSTGKKVVPLGWTAPKR